MSDEIQSEEPKRRGRPPASEVKAVRGRPNDELIKRRAERKKRGVVDHGFDKRLAVDESKLDKDNHTYRWVRDDPGRIKRLQDQEWEVVPSEEVGSQEVARHGGSDRDGKPMQAVLMKKWKPWDQEDREAKLRLGKEQDAALMRGKAKELLTQGGGGFDYAPDSNSLSQASVQVSRRDTTVGE